MRTLSRAAFGIAVGVAAVLSVSACRQPPTGPSLADVTVENIALRPTTGNAGLCCCRIAANVINQNTVPVHVTLKFWAFGEGSSLDEDDAISAIFHFVPDLEPSTSRPIDAAGFIFPCSAIRQVKTEVDVKGITYPPL
jgi:hypothetical protein